VVSILSDRVSYTAGLRELSDSMVDAQRPIRILDAIKWDERVREGFFKSRCRELPAVDVAENEP